jgi:hypothetical protein
VYGGVRTKPVIPSIFNTRSELNARDLEARVLESLSNLARRGDVRTQVMPQNWMQYMSPPIIRPGSISGGQFHTLPYKPNQAVAREVPTEVRPPQKDWPIWSNRPYQSPPFVGPSKPRPSDGTFHILPYKPNQAVARSMFHILPYKPNQAVARSTFQSPPFVAPEAIPRPPYGSSVRPTRPGRPLSPSVRPLTQ